MIEGGLIIEESICELIKNLRGYSQKLKTDKNAISTQFPQPTAMKIASVTIPSAASYEYPTKTTAIPP